MGITGYALALVALFATTAFPQTPFSIIPTISDVVKENALKAGARDFVRLWEYALKVDGQGPGPASRFNIEAKTVLAPGSTAVLNLIPQDAGDPRYGDTEEAKTVRRNYLKDHLVLDPIKPTDPNIAKKDGIRALTISGKDVYIRKDDKGKLFVGDVLVSNALSLNDGTQIYILDDILFDNREKVDHLFYSRNGFELNGPTGPPLDISGVEGIAAPAPPPPFPRVSIIGPPAPPPALPEIRAPAPPVFSEARPPAPPRFSVASPPAPPVFSGIRPPAPPPQAISGFGVPAPPADFMDIRAPAPPPGFLSALFSGPPSPPKPPAPPVLDDSIFFPANVGKRVKRQLNFPGLDDLRSLDPALKGDSSDLVLPKDFTFSPTSSGGGYGHTSQQRGTEGSPQGPRVFENRPLNELSSIEQFATLFQLSNSPDDTIVRVLQEAGLVTMLGLLETSGLLQHLVSGEKGPFILLVPSEEAFSSLSHRELNDLARGSDLSYHMIPLQGQPAPEVTNDSTFVTLLGPKLRFNVYGGTVYANGVPVSRGDLAFSHGTIQVIESVLQPPIGDLRGVLVNSGRPVNRINTLLTVISSLEQGDYTLLAPPDSAISSKGYSWPGLLMQRNLGKGLLERHMLKGTWYSEGLLHQRTLTTLAGTSVTFRRDADGRLTANGVPMKTCNLSATNGVVHLVADVIPDSDLGSDPTTIPNPLIAQTESSIFASFAEAGDITPDVPVISGLYELPGRDPFQEFIPVNSNPTDSERSDLSSPNTEQLSPDTTFFQNFPGNGQNIFSTPQEFNNIQPVKNDSSHGVPQVLQPQALKYQSNEQPSPDLISFFDMLDETAGDFPNGESVTLHPQLHTKGNNFPTVTNNNAKPSPTIDHSLPQLSHENQYYHSDTRTDVTGSPIDTDTQKTFVTGNLLQNPTVTTLGSIVKEKPITSPELIILVDPTSQTVTNGAITTLEPNTVNIQRYFPESEGNYTTNLDFNVESQPAPSVGPDLYEGYGNEFEAPSQQSPFIPLVPEDSFVWTPEGVITEDERKEMNVLSLLQRLNLTTFAELVAISGLSRTLNLDGPWTVFAPSNEAINTIPESALQEMIAHPRFLRRVVSYHLVPGRFLSSSHFRPGIHLPTLHAGHTLVLSYYTDGPLARWVAGGSVITDLDEDAANGVVHVVDRVLYAPYGHLITTISLSPLLTVFSSILAGDEDLQNYFTGPGPITVFAPSDESLQNFTIPEDQLARRAWILSHVVEGTWYTAGFSDSWPLFSVNNDTLITSISNNAEEVTVNGIEITFADVTASNGVLHVLQFPLFSPT